MRQSLRCSFLLCLLISGCTWLDSRTILSTPRGEYMGERVDGVRQGVGRYTFTDGQFYQGEFHQGNFHGKGRFQYGNGDYYDGEWVNNQRQGEGTYHFSAGGKYTGFWKNDHQEGQGILIEENGNQYQGDWLKGLPDGKGIKQFNDGRLYKGEFKQGNFSGQGLYETPDGRRYEGHWLTGKRNGYGEFVFSNGDRYQGFWKNNQLHGLGRYDFATGFYYQGDFQQGHFQGAGKLVVPERLEYEGEFYNHRFHGLGRLLLTADGKYEGTFRDGIFNGPGAFYFKNGDQYRGEWQNGRPDGYGHYRQPQQADFSGLWRQGVLVKKADKFTLKIPERRQGIFNLASVNLDNWVIENHGSAVFISSNGHLLTTANVVKGCEQISFKRHGKDFFVSVYIEDLASNLALLKAAIIPAFSLTLSNDKNFLMKELWIGKSPTKAQGVVGSSIESVVITALNGVQNKVTELQLEGGFEKAHGGSPVVDNKGRLMALLEDKRALEKDSKFWRPVTNNTHFAIKVQTIKQFLKDDIIVSPSGNGLIKSDADLETLIVESTVDISCWMSGAKVE